MYNKENTIDIESLKRITIYIALHTCTNTNVNSGEFGDSCWERGRSECIYRYSVPGGGGDSVNNTL